MPIVFDQPSPVGMPAGAAAAQAGGQVEQENRNRQYYAQLLSLAGRGGGGGGTGGGEMNAQLATQAAIARMRSQQQTAENAADRQQQSALLAQRQQGNIDEFTFADNIRLQQLQAGKAQLQEMYDNGEVDQEGFSQGVSQLHGVIGPLQVRKQQAQAKAMEQEVQQAAEAAKSHAVGTKTFQDFVTAGKPPIQKLPDGGLLVFQPDGKVQYHKPEKEATEKDTLPPGVMTNAQWHAEHDRIVKTAMQELKMGKAPDDHTPLNEEEFGKAVRRHKDWARFTDNSYDDYLKRMKGGNSSTPPASVDVGKKLTPEEQKLRDQHLNGQGGNAPPPAPPTLTAAMEKARSAGDGNASMAIDMLLSWKEKYPDLNQMPVNARPLYLRDKAKAEAAYAKYGSQ